MLETVREFGLERLSQWAGEGSSRSPRRVLPAVCGGGRAGTVRRRQREGVALLEAELANLRAALVWLGERERAEPALRLAGALKRFWYLRGRYGEGRAHLEAALAPPGEVDLSLGQKRWLEPANWPTGRVTTHCGGTLKKP